MGLRTGLMGVWLFENNWTDALGLNNFTPNDSPTFVTPGKTGAYAAAFLASDSDARRSSVTFAYTDDQQLSVSFWIKGPWPSVTTVNQLVKFSDAGSTVAWQFDLVEPSGGADIRFRIYVRRDASNVARWDYSPSIKVDDTDWHHVFWVLDLSIATVADRLSLWFDGTEVSPSLASNTPPTTFQDGSGIFLAGNLGSTGGYMDQLALWNRALGQSAVDELYNSGAGVPYV